MLLLIDVVAIPNFFALRIQDGHLYGILIDILKNGTPTALIALGMTLVIATRGIDLSVGATVAIAGSVACTWIAGAPDPHRPADGRRRRAARAGAEPGPRRVERHARRRCSASSRSSRRSC